LRLENGQLLLLVSNTFDRAPRMVDGMPVAGHTGHGFGTKSIKLAVERMNGNCQFRINGDRFELRAVM
ncbi:MAG: GHKL domain-containing protein, partial [Collinsella sp.]|nr:GHKL domain-containing protein [Collinsella sp.]